jgi:hypothetical protein
MRSSSTSRRFRHRLAIVLALVSVGVVPVAAEATTINYWGYGNLTLSNPASGTCPSQPSGFPCSGWNNWDYSQVDWNSGQGSFRLGFICQGTGYLTGPQFYGNEGFQTWTVAWTVCPTHYNRSGVEYITNIYGTYDYLQARALIFP